MNFHARALLVAYESGTEIAVGTLARVARVSSRSLTC